MAAAGGGAGANPLAAMSAMMGGRGAGGSLGALGAMPNLGALTSPAISTLTGLSNGVQKAAMPAGGGPVLTRNSPPREVAARITWEAHRRGYSRPPAIAILSTAMQESGLNPRASGGGGAWHSIFQQDGSYAGHEIRTSTLLSSSIGSLSREAPVQRTSGSRFSGCSNAPVRHRKRCLCERTPGVLVRGPASATRGQPHVRHRHGFLKKQLFGRASPFP